MAGSDPDYALRDLYEAIIAQQQYPSWTLYVQVMSVDEAASETLNPFDVTKVWPQSTCPQIEVDRLALSRNPRNSFAEIELNILQRRWCTRRRPCNCGRLPTFSSAMHTMDALRAGKSGRADGSSAAHPTASQLNPPRKPFVPTPPSDEMTPRLGVRIGRSYLLLLDGQFGSGGRVGSVSCTFIL